MSFVNSLKNEPVEGRRHTTSAQAMADLSDNRG